MKTLKVILLAATIFAINNCTIAQNYYVKSGNGLNLRSGSGADNSVVISIPPNGEVKVINKGLIVEGDEWWNVEYEGKRGFVSAKYLTEDKSEANAAAKGNKKKRSSLTSGGAGSGASVLDGNWGIGLRLGDPSGITAKKYLEDGKALELVVGRTAFWGLGYYERRFDDWDDYKGYDYLDNKVKSAISIQLHYLFHKDINIENLVGGLQWYYGGGVQFRLLSISYSYRYKSYYGPDDDDYLWVYEEDRANEFDVGIDGAGGVEYTFENVPITVFVDGNLFIEIVNDPFVFRWQSGIGGRYNF